MFLANVVLTTCTCLCFVKYVHVTFAQEQEPYTSNEAEAPEIKPIVGLEVQQKIALIDIVYTNGKKRTCTGAIIHDNVVITAGHCFLGPKTGGPITRPELTASFVVIGDEKKFETGYEQYLPIERVIMNPNIKDYHADIALVHTFASMTADKIGAVIQLVGEKNKMDRESNISILSWGRIVDESEQETPREDIDSCEGRRDGEDQYLRCKIKKGDFRGHGQYASDSAEKKLRYQQLSESLRKRDPSERKEATKGQYSSFTQAKNTPMRRGPGIPSKMNSNIYTTTKISRYLSSGEQKNGLNKEPLQPKRHRFMKINRNETSTTMKIENLRSATLSKADEGRGPRYPVQTNTKRPRVPEYPLKVQVYGEDEPQLPEYPMKIYENVRRNTKVNNTGFVMRSNRHLQRKMNIKFKARTRNWRRQMGAKEGNKLTVEQFSVLDAMSCRKFTLVNLPRLKSNLDDVICYSSDDHYVTDEDSGAPVIYQGELLAITLGSIKTDDNNHVAFGLKLNYFCPWIAENLPAGDTTIICWENPYDLTSTSTSIKNKATTEQKVEPSTLLNKAKSEEKLEPTTNNNLTLTSPVVPRNKRTLSDTENVLKNRYLGKP